MLVKSAFERLRPERKKKLIDTAMDLYFEMSFEEITIRVLVDRLGINMNTFYRYFETKDDLFLYIFKGIMEKAMKNIDPAKILDEFQYMPGEVLDNREERFPEKLPARVLHRVYFELQTELRALYKEALLLKQKAGLIRKEADLDLLAYMYVTTEYNLSMYWKEKRPGQTVVDSHGNVDPEWYKIKEYFYYDFFRYGISGMKPESKLIGQYNENL